MTGRRGRKHKDLLDDLKKKKVLELEMSGGLALEEAVVMSRDRLRNE